MGSNLAEFDPSQDYVSKVKQLCDKERLGHRYEECAAPSGFLFGGVAKIDGKSYGVGVGGNKKEAKKQAYWIALSALSQETAGASVPSLAFGRSPKRELIAEYREGRKDAITTLKEIADQRRQLPRYNETENAPGSKFKFSCKIFLENVQGMGSGHTKREAKSEASEIALRRVLSQDRESRSELPVVSGRRRHLSSPQRKESADAKGFLPLAKTSSVPGLVSPASDYLAQPLWPEVAGRDDAADLRNLCANNGPRRPSEPNDI